MYHRPKSTKAWKTRRRRCDVSGISHFTSSKRSRSKRKRTSSSMTPFTSAHMGTTRPTSNQAAVSTLICSVSPAKRYKENGYGLSRGWRSLRKKNTRDVRDSKRVKERRSSWSSTPSPHLQSPRVQNNSGHHQGALLPFVSGQDITSCSWLYYGAHIGNETRNVEFKQGRGRYMQEIFYEHVCVYGCAFLNSGGGSLLVGVRDDGVVCGVSFSHKLEDETRLQVDLIVKLFKPPLLPYNYSLHFLPVVKPGDEGHQLKVLRLTFRPPPAFTEPTLFQIDQGKVYMRRDGSVQGPLGPSVIIEWSRQMWTDKVQQLEQYVREARNENWFLAGQIQGLLRSIAPLHQVIVSLQSQENTAPYRRQKHKRKQNKRSVSRQMSTASTSHTPEPDLALGSPPPPEHSQM